MACTHGQRAGWVRTERTDVDRARVSGLELGQRNPTVVTLLHTVEGSGEVRIIFLN